jgi:hypothetical protein
MCWLYAKESDRPAWPSNSLARAMPQALMRSMHVWLVGHPSLMRAAWIGLLLILAACQNDSGGGGGGVPGY